MKATEIKINPKLMTALVNITDMPKIVLVSAGKVKELDMPYQGEINVRTVNGRIEEYNFREGERF
ncbi:XtrA/YqaO family protein [Anaerobacillus sp. MEB173]|uniref:XtrA/YqaO family protein n=1 Tax=Anaerobacillus sp. MEB173 TaxID=3383345 RepID=UPI003F8DC14C